MALRLSRLQSLVVLMSLFERLWFGLVRPCISSLGLVALQALCGPNKVWAKAPMGVPAFRSLVGLCTEVACSMGGGHLHLLWWNFGTWIGVCGGGEKSGAPGGLASRALTQ